METLTFSVRMNRDLKKEFADTCSSFGMNISTAINVFARAVVHQKQIPFKIISTTDNEFIDSVETLRNEAKKNKKTKMTLKEINDIIAKTRKEL